MKKVVFLKNHLRNLMAAKITLNHLKRSSVTVQLVFITFHHDQYSLFQAVTGTTCITSYYCLKLHGILENSTDKGFLLMCLKIPFTCHA